MRQPDPDSVRYATYWEPVLAPPGRRLLERIDASPAVYLDVGAGTGALVAIAAGRWPRARIVALDASAGMLSVARSRVEDHSGADGGGRFEWLAADAAVMPLDDASVDVVSACFMLQVVEDRLAVLREIRRVLRPEGTFGLVTWLAGDLVLPADEDFADVVARLGTVAEGGGFRPGRTTDYVSLGEAETELRSAGFESVDVRADELRHAWTPDEYLLFKERYDERDVFEALDDDRRERLRAAIRSRWAASPADAFSISGPLVSATARRP